MKYMLLIYDNDDIRRRWLTSPDGRVHMQRMAESTEALRASGELVAGDPLADPSQTRTVRTVDGTPAVTDGPFAESKEYLGGYMIVDVDSPERAAEIAETFFPTPFFTAIEVRPLMDRGGGDA